ncbi:MAG TPA: hypothetical protein PK569_14490 [Thermoanaerobaculia bacterium]|nr:hypothetical protein [Thermoanaerobaculia bacterium]
MKDPNDDKGKGGEGSGSGAGGTGNEGAGAQGGSGDGKGTPDPAEVERLRTHNLQLEKDLAKTREKAKDLESRYNALRKVALGDDAGNDDPRDVLKRKEEADRKAAAEAADRRQKDLEFQVSFSREMARAGLLPKDGDPDFVDFKVNRTEKLSALKDAGKVKELIEELKKDGFLVGASGAGGSLNPGMGRSSSDGAPPDPRFGSVKSFSDLVKLGPVAVDEYSRKYPKEFAAMQSADASRMSRPTK